MASDIIGLGLIGSLGADRTAVWNQVLAGAVGLRTLDRFALTDLNVTRGGQLPPAVEAAARAGRDDGEDLAFALLLKAAREALADVPSDPATGLVLATNFGLLETRQWCWRERLDVQELDAATFARQQDVSARAAAALGLTGPTAEVSLSCASGAAAIALACQWLRAGRCRRVLAVGYDSLTEFCWCGLANLHTITAGELRPFDAARQGTIFGEGAAAALLTSEPVPPERSLGQVLGSATNNNAYHLTAPGKDADGSRRALAAALADAGVAPDAVDFVCAHATGTVANDRSEAAAINALLNRRRVPVAAFKSCLGHLLGAAGLAEFVLTAEALRRGVLPASANLTQPDPQCDVDAVRDQPRVGAYRVALTNSAGLGGNNAALVVARAGTAVAEPTRLKRPVRLVRCGWVLPGQVGAGAVPPAVDPEALSAQNAALAEFAVKPYLHSVKGYLDPAGAFSLAAAALCLGDARPASGERTAVVSATQYGAPVSGFHFFAQMVHKGHHFASPLIFPHAYANTAGNLVAIEFGLSGPHLAFDAATDGAEAWWAAVDLVRTGQADDALLVLYEATTPDVLPPGTAVLNGALCCHLTAAPGPAAPPRPAAPANRRGVLHPALGVWRWPAP